MTNNQMLIAAVVLGLIIAIVMEFPGLFRKKKQPKKKGAIVVATQPRYAVAGAAPNQYKPASQGKALFFALFVMPIGMTIYAFLFGLFIAGFMMLPENISQYVHALLVIDIFGFALAFRYCLPRDYFKQKKKDVHTPVDWTVGIIASICFIAVGVYHVSVMGGGDVLLSVN